MDQIVGTYWTWWETVKSGLAILGLAGFILTSSATFAYRFFKWFGAKWIENKFQNQLEAYKSEQSRELVRLNHQINGLLDRTVRLHTKEFELLHDLFGKLVEAHAWAASYVSEYQEVIDFKRMSDDELQEYLDGTKFMNSQKRDIKAASRSDRQGVYTKIAELYRHNDTIVRLRSFTTTFQRGIIFVRPEFQNDMQVLADIIEAAIREKHINAREDIRPPIREAYKRFTIEAKPLLEKITQSVSDRLWEATRTEV